MLPGNIVLVTAVRTHIALVSDSAGYLERVLVIHAVVAAAYNMLTYGASNNVKNWLRRD